MNANSNLFDPHRIEKASRRFRTTVVAFLSMLPLVLGGCQENEISFFVEHVKVKPKAPSCSYSVSDDKMSYGAIDLAFGNRYTNGYLVQNQLMAREDYDNLIAETNGIFVEAYEVNIRTSDAREVFGTSERIPFEMYLEPETSDLIVVDILTESVVWELAEATQCLGLSRENYPPETMFTSAHDLEDRNGLPVPRYFESVYTQIRFFGHSQGGIDLETQAFTFPINLCCGCFVEWGKCYRECERYCTETEDFDAHSMCVLGNFNGDESKLDCREIYQNFSMEWDCLEAEDGQCDCDTCDQN